MNQHIKVCSSVSLSLVVAMLIGCGHRESRFAVSGRVTLDGIPVSKAVVSFVPRAGQVGTEAIAIVSDGEFKVKSPNGLVAGEYEVRISDNKPELEEFEAKRFSGEAPISVSVIPARYAGTHAFQIRIDGPKSDVLLEMTKQKSSKP